MSGAFLESPRFPDDLAIWSKSGVGWSNQVVTVKSGREQRNQLWTYPRARFDIANALRVVALKGEGTATYNIALVRNWILAMQGQYSGFRFKDWTDFSDEGGGVFAAVPDGVTTVFQMAKNYGIGTVTIQRAIYKPITSPAASIYKNAGLLTVTTDYTIDTTTGLVTFIATPVLASFTGSISGTTLSVSAVTGTIVIGQTLAGANVTAGTLITAGSGSTWTVNNSQAVGSEAMTSHDTLTWSGQFDIPVRFAADLIDYALGLDGFYVVQTIPLIEIRI